MRIDAKAIGGIATVIGIGAGIGAATSALNKPENRDGVTKFAGIATAVGAAATGALLLAAHRTPNEGAIVWAILAGGAGMATLGAGGAALGALGVAKATT